MKLPTSNPCPRCGVPQADWDDTGPTIACSMCGLEFEIKAAPTMDLLVRLQNHIASMAPHQKDRYAGKLLIEAREEIERLRKARDECERQFQEKVSEIARLLP